LGKKRRGGERDMIDALGVFSVGLYRKGLLGRIKESAERKRA